MDIKYQVFLSSTYKDLATERKEVIQALLELDCIPVGMELFPAADDDQWTLIKDLIDNCDYYILIVGGRYGSVNKNGISYTQMEYEYATQQGIPVISFLHKSPESIVVSKTDNNADMAAKLEAFRQLAQQKVCKFWATPEELGSVVSRSLVKLIKTKPRTGWVRADNLSSVEANLQIFKLNKELNDLKEKQRLAEETSTSGLSQGDDEYELQYAYNTTKNGSLIIGKIKVSWNKLFSKTCSILMDEAKEQVFKDFVSTYIEYLTKDKHESSTLYIVKDYFLSILIQFKALGLIEKSIKNRSLKDTDTYWKLTNKGDELLTHLRAKKRKAPVNKN